MARVVPRHRPPQSVGGALAALARGCLQRTSATRIEDRYARLWNVDHVVWIPSARFGITHAIRQCPQPIETVYTSAFNCGAVFHAAAETGCQIRYVDTTPNSFLMNTTAAPAPQSAVILSEMFGQSFPPTQHRQPLIHDSLLRVFDMAMSLPHADRFTPLRDHDVAVVSFGLGKSMYAGWGGLAVTPSAETAARLRSARDRSLLTAGRLAALQHDTKVLARVAAHLPGIYGPLRQRQATASPAPSTFSRQSFSTHTHEWHRGVSPLHVRLALDNADHAAAWSHQRRLLTDRYRTALRDVLDVEHLPAATDDPLSHFCIRVPAAARSAVRQQLWHHGIDAATLFPTPADLCPPADFPHATRASAEVLNLPLSCQLTELQVDKMARKVASTVLASADHTAVRPILHAA